jgi:hypothetical protein
MKGARMTGRLTMAVAAALIATASGAAAESAAAPATWSYSLEPAAEGGMRHMLTLEAKDTRQRVKAGDRDVPLGALPTLAVICTAKREVAIVFTFDDPLWTPDTGKRWWLFGAPVLRARYILDAREPRRIRFEVEAGAADKPLRFGYWRPHRAKEFMRILAPRKRLRLRVPMRLKRGTGKQTPVYEFAVAGLIEAATAFPAECRP